MRPFKPFCGTVSNAQLFTLPPIIRMIAPGVVTTQLSFLAPASSSATFVAGSSLKRPATAQPPEPPPTTMKSTSSMICLLLKTKCWLCYCSLNSRQEAQQLLQSRDLRAIGRVEIAQAIEFRAIEYRLHLAQGVKAPLAVIGATAGGADAAHRLVRLHEMKQAVVDGDAAGHRARQYLVPRHLVLAEPVQRQRPVAAVDVVDRFR